MSKGKKGQDLDRWFGAKVAVMLALYQTVDLPVFPRSNPHPWSLTLGSDRKNKVTDASSQNEVRPESGWAQL